MIMCIFCHIVMLLYMYFAVPTPPHDLRVTPVSETELQVEWQPPRTPNSNITHYYVHWRPVEHDPDYFNQRDYCVDGKVHISD